MLTMCQKNLIDSRFFHQILQLKYHDQFLRVQWFLKFTIKFQAFVSLFKIISRKAAKGLEVFST